MLDFLCGSVVSDLLLFAPRIRGGLPAKPYFNPVTTYACDNTRT